MGLFARITCAAMAVGKNKGLKISGKKGAKKKIVDPFTRKDWYDIKAPACFKVRDIGKTLVNRTQGTRIASDGLKSRVFEVSLADLQGEGSAERSFRKFRFICDDVQGKNCLTSFYGMSLTSDKLKGIVKKWQSLIECYTDVKTLTVILFALVSLDSLTEPSLTKRLAMPSPLRFARSVKGCLRSSPVRSATAAPGS